MNYKKHYDLLIKKRKNNPPEGYGENHHIVPRCAGGDNTKDNIVKLTAREHYIAHALLFKHYRSSKLAHAWFSMLRISENQERHFTSRQYESAKNAHVSALRENMKGDRNPFYGKTHTQETIEKIKKANREYTKTKEQIDNWIEKVAKKPASDKQKKILSENSKGKIMLKNIHTGECVKIDRNEISEYDSKIWKNPAAISQRRDTCIYCGKESVAGNIKRWHNENCKRINL